MRYFSNHDSYDFKWDQVTAAFWKKYPNPQSGHVLSEDVIFRQINNGSLVTKRLLTKTNGMPPLAERLVGKVGNSVKIVEESVVDLKKKTFTTYTRNIGLTHVMQVEEKCVYTPDPTDSSKTMCVRQAWVTSNLMGVSRAVTQIGIARLKKNVHKASQGFKYVLEDLFGHAAKFRERAKFATEIAKYRIPVVRAAESE
ncbi:PRELI domain-containing protein 1, mitochondrial [Galendromus occidentalis]|uniref:PRELI domain-containing protein 1, mitochondrial n=1 Tax=Galendromus occidentalis TaxID=34638 RepID=A0AAJ6VYI9_9ACAR|nr:PRELI domain-containing protein 1, mitochondrial [Galendromus occidentalis]